MRKIRINYKDGRHKTIKTNIHTVESLKKEVKDAVEEGKDYMLVSGIEVYPDQVTEIKNHK
jgi:delta-aminolevulinic acid dehydratase/porphobilinogen synthase